MVATPQPTYSPSASSCQSQGGSILGDASDNSHLIPHSVPHQSQNGESSPTSMAETSNVQISINQAQHANICESEIAEDEVAIAQYPTTVKIEEMNDDGAGQNETSTGHPYLSSNQHQNLLNVTSAALNSVENYPRSVHHHHHINATERSIGDPGVLYEIYP